MTAQKMNEKTIQSFMGTILESALFATDEEIQSAFKEMKAPDPKKEEKEIGQLTPAEKSIWYARSIRITEIKNFTKEMPKDFKQLSQWMEKIEGKKAEVNLLEKLFWKMIRNRIPETENANVIGIAKSGDGNIIVVSTKEDEDENFSFSFPFPFGEITVVELKKKQ